jgi:hypothetical protein
VRRVVSTSWRAASRWPMPLARVACSCPYSPAAGRDPPLPIVLAPRDLSDNSDQHNIEPYQGSLKPAGFRD